MHKSFAYMSLLQIIQAYVSDPKGSWSVEVSSWSTFNGAFSSSEDASKSRNQKKKKKRHSAVCAKAVASEIR